VLSPIFQRLNDKDRRDFYEKNKDKFTTPGEVTISEIFLTLEGHTADEVDQRAKRLVSRASGGQELCRRGAGRTRRRVALLARRRARSGLQTWRAQT